jgi:hypothetical protein
MISVFILLSRDHCILEGINVLNIITPEKWYYLVSVFFFVFIQILENLGL